MKNEGLYLLTGYTAGVRSTEGAYPSGSVHRLMEARLQRYAKQMRAFSAGQKKAQNSR